MKLLNFSRSWLTEQFSLLSHHRSDISDSRLFSDLVNDQLLLLLPPATTGWRFVESNVGRKATRKLVDIQSRLECGFWYYFCFCPNGSIVKYVAHRLRSWATGFEYWLRDTFFLALLSISSTQNNDRDIYGAMTKSRRVNSLNVNSP